MLRDFVFTLYKLLVKTKKYIYKKKHAFGEVLSFLREFNL